MTQQQPKITDFKTYGPNRGLTLKIGNHQFVDGVCSLPTEIAPSVAKILCRYHDVCYTHEFKEKAAKYDKKYKRPKTLEEMSADELETYAKEKFQVDVDKRKSKKILLAQVKELEEKKASNVGDDETINKANAETANANNKQVNNDEQSK